MERIVIFFLFLFAPYAVGSAVKVALSASCQVIHPPTGDLLPCKQPNRAYKLIPIIPIQADALLQIPSLTCKTFQFPPALSQAP